MYSTEIKNILERAVADNYYVQEDFNGKPCASAECLLARLKERSQDVIDLIHILEDERIYD